MISANQTIVDNAFQKTLSELKAHRLAGPKNSSPDPNKREELRLQGGGALGKPSLKS